MTSLKRHFLKNVPTKFNKIFRQGVKLMSDKVLKVCWRYLTYFLRYCEYSRGGQNLPPPPPAGRGLILFLAGSKRLGIVRERGGGGFRHCSENEKKMFDSSYKVLSKQLGSYFSQAKIEVTRGHQTSHFPQFSVFRQAIVNISKTMIEQISKNHKIALEEPR